MIDWVNRPNNKQILFSFSAPKFPSEVKRELQIKRFSLKPFLKRGLIICLNPNARKGRLYILTNKTKKILKIPISATANTKNFDLLGWVRRSHLQRVVVLKTLSLNSEKLTSEEIRLKSKPQNPCLSRISTKSILQELIDRELVETEIGVDRRRYYWINEDGKLLAKDLYQIIQEEFR